MKNEIRWQLGYQFGTTDLESSLVFAMPIYSLIIIVFKLSGWDFRCVFLPRRNTQIGAHVNSPILGRQHPVWSTSVLHILPKISCTGTQPARAAFGHQWNVDIETCETTDLVREVSPSWKLLRILGRRVISPTWQTTFTYLLAATKQRTYNHKPLHTLKDL